MLDLFEKMELDIIDKDISDCHRIWPNPKVKTNRKYPPVVIIRFVSRQTTEQIVKNKEKLVDNIFVTEDLSALKIKLISFLKFKVEDVQTSSVHTRRGKILCKRKSEDGWFYLNSALDLRNVGITNWDLDLLGLDDCALPRIRNEQYRHATLYTFHRNNNIISDAKSNKFQFKIRLNQYKIKERFLKSNKLCSFCHDKEGKYIHGVRTLLKYDTNFSCNDCVLDVSIELNDQSVDNNLKLNKNQCNLNNINIIGLNVYGLASKLRLGILDEYAKDFHIICLSETKTDAPDLIDTALCDYTCFVKSKSIKKHKFGGIHGLCMLVSENISKHAKLLEENYSKHVLWVYFNKKAFGLSCVFGSVYIPHEASKYYNKELFDELAEDIINIKSKYDAPICLLGDFNSRTGTLDDFTVLEEQISEICNLDNNEIDVFNSKQYFEERGLNTNRSNKDNFTNNNGYKLIEICRCLDLKIVNGRIGSDQNIGDFTCISNQGSSTQDYCIASSDFFSIF